MTTSGAHSLVKSKLGFSPSCIHLAIVCVLPKITFSQAHLSSFRGVTCFSLFKPLDDLFQRLIGYRNIQNFNGGLVQAYTRFFNSRLNGTPNSGNQSGRLIRPTGLKSRMHPSDSAYSTDLFPWLRPSLFDHYRHLPLKKQGNYIFNTRAHMASCILQCIRNIVYLDCFLFCIFYHFPSIASRMPHISD